MEIFNSICTLLAGIGVFLLGIKLMGDGLEAGSSKSIKKIFASIQDNRFAGVAIGAGTTAVIQSSSATTVMVVGFVNAGVMSLFQATAIIMGANIGTTITAFLGVMGSLPISSIFMMSGFIGIFLYMFAKNTNLRIAGQIIVGLAIIFVGMNFMSSAFKSSAALTNAFKSAFKYFSTQPLGPLFLLLIGAVFTGIIQSSSAATVMVINMTADGILSAQSALFVVIGANIGTCVTALLASIGTSPNARRASVIHIMFNTVGALVFLPILWILGSSPANLLLSLAGGNQALATSYFHLFFNISLTLVLVWFINPIVKLATRLVKSHNEQDAGEFKLQFINDKLLDSSGIELAMKEIKNMASLARANIETSLNEILTNDLSQKDSIILTEQKVNFTNKGIGQYIVKVPKDKLPLNDQLFLNSLHNVTSNIERIGDYAMSFYEEARAMVENKTKFTAVAVEELKSMFETIAKLYDLSMEVFETRDESKLDDVTALGANVSEAKQTLSFSHVARLNAGLCNVEGGVHFYAIITGLEHVADHLMNVAFSIKPGLQFSTLKQLGRENPEKSTTKQSVYW